MNVFKFLSATLPAGTCLFSGCKKEKSIVPENPSVHIPADTRSAFPVISVQSPVSIQCCWQS